MLPVSLRPKAAGERRMRENRTSGVARGEGVLSGVLPYSTVFTKCGMRPREVAMWDAPESGVVSTARRGYALGSTGGGSGEAAAGSGVGSSSVWPRASR